MFNMSFERLNLVQKNDFNFFFVNQATFQAFNLIFKMFRLYPDILHLLGSFPRFMEFGLFVSHQTCIVFVYKTRTARALKCDRNLHYLVDLSTLYGGFIFETSINE